jgi:bloom syndrome protein
MGHPQIRLLYMTPETLLGAKLRYELEKAYEQGQLNRLVVDEVSSITARVSTEYRRMSLR